MLDHLQDIRGTLARGAHDELTQLSGRDVGYDELAWTRWFDGWVKTPRIERTREMKAATEKWKQEVAPETGAPR